MRWLLMLGDSNNGFYNTKIIKSGDNVELYFYESTKNINFEGSDFERRKFADLNLIEKKESLKKREKYYKNKRFEIKRIIDCNLTGNDKFVTLTFEKHIIDECISNNLFKKFIMRLRYRLDKDIKYLAVIERTKIGRVHYHIVFFDFNYITNSELRDIWGHGFVKINTIGKVGMNVDGNKVDYKNIGLYISKYFAKDYEIDDFDLEKGTLKKGDKKKAYLQSRNLNKPQVDKFYDGSNQEFLKMLKGSGKVSFHKDYSVFNGFNQYNDEVEYSKVDYVVLMKDDFEDIVCRL